MELWKARAQRVWDRLERVAAEFREAVRVRKAAKEAREKVVSLCFEAATPVLQVRWP